MKYEDVRERLAGFVAGIASGCTKLIVGHPFDTIKIRLQTEGSHGRFKGLWDCMRTTFKTEGIRGFYKGATPPLFGWAMMDAVMWVHFKWSNWKLNIAVVNYPSLPSDLSYPQHALAGLGTGICVTFVATPIENTKARLQVQYDKETTRYNGPLDCIRQTIRVNGLIGLYRGFIACILFRSQFAILWSGYEFYTRLFQNRQGLFRVSETLVPFLAGGMAANTFWLIAFPTDVIKNRIMSQPETRPLKYPSLRACIRIILKTEGVRGFYKGFLPAMLRSFPTNGAALFVFDNCMTFIKKC